MWNEKRAYDIGDLIYVKMINRQIWEVTGKQSHGYYDSKIDKKEQVSVYTVQSIYTGEIKKAHEDDIMLVCKSEYATQQKKTFINNKGLYGKVSRNERKEDKPMEDVTNTVSNEVNDMLDKITYDRNLDHLLEELASLVAKRDSNKNNKTVIKKIEKTKLQLEELTKDISNNKKEAERMES